MAQEYQIQILKKEDHSEQFIVSLPHGASPAETVVYQGAVRTDMAIREQNDIRQNHYSARYYRMVGSPSASGEHTSGV
jgi:hypothetical protein